MKAITFQGVRELAFDTVADPVIESPSDALVEVRRTAICGSDLHVYLGRETGNDPGTPMGHEFLGTVVEVGRDVTTLERGDVVVSPFTTSCGSCFYCRQGLTCRCEKGQLYGWVEGGAGLPGAQAEYVRVPMADATAFKVAPDLDEDAALFLGDILATGFFCADMAEVQPGGTYAVIGCGPVGLLAAVAAHELGSEPVYALDVVPERLALAERFGAIPIHVHEQNPVEVLRDATDGRGADAVLEVVGSPEATRLAFELVRAGGIVSAVGVHTESEFAFSPAEAYDKNLTYRAGRCPARHYMKRLLPLVEAGKYDLGEIVSHRMKLAEGVRAYELFDQKLENCTKVVLTP